MACPFVRGAHQRLKRMAGVSPSTKPSRPSKGSIWPISTSIGGCSADPAETDMQKYFRISPPSVHQMVLALQRAGLTEGSQEHLAASRSLLIRNTCPS
jgi:hypothetical protein